VCMDLCVVLVIDVCMNVLSTLDMIAWSGRRRHILVPSDTL
jgi:hypothetical protein